MSFFIDYTCTIVYYYINMDSEKCKKTQSLLENEEENVDDRKKREYIRKYGYTNDGYNRANCISKIFFYWAYRIIKLSNNVKLEKDHLGKPEKQAASKQYLHNINYLWEDKQYKKRKKNALLCTVLRNNVCNIILMILFSLLVTALEFFGVYLFRLYILAFDKTKKEPQKYETYQIAIVLFSVKIVCETFKKLLNQFQQIVGFQSGFELNCFIYSKVLRVSQASNGNKSTEGQIINHLQVDSDRFGMTLQQSPAILTVPIMLVAYSYMLFVYFGYAFLFGLGILIITLTINYFIYKGYRTMMKENLRLKDKRMGITSETINCLKILKLYSWEHEYIKRIEKARNEELGYLKRIWCLTIFNIGMSFLAPQLMSFVSIGAYQYLEDVMKIEDILVCLNIFIIISGPIRQLPYVFNSIVDTIVAMARIEKFINQADIDESNVSTCLNHICAIRIQGLSFSWGKELSSENKGNETVQNSKTDKTKIHPKEKEKNQSIAIQDESVNTEKVAINREISHDKSTLIVDKESEMRRVLNKINFEVAKGEFVAIIGEVGSGKSSLLQAIMNNMILLDKENNKKIEVSGSIAYVSQTAWIQNATLKDNIVFNHDFDKEWYDKVIELCELQQDIDSLIGGDLTEIGEKGINLSGGQKARVSIARALYSNRDIYLLDDPLSALDAHVGENIMKYVFLKELNTKTRVLVTHAIHFLNMVDRIIYINNGNILFDGTYADFINNELGQEYNEKLLKKASKENQENSSKAGSSSEIVDDKKETKAEKKIIVEEEREEGSVSCTIYKKYLFYMGGCFYLSLILLIMAIWQALKGGSDLWLLHWQDLQNKDENWKYLGIYGGLGVGSSIFVFFRVWILTSCCIKASRKMHEEMINSLVKAPINLFHDTVPKGRILNRLSKDLAAIDIYSQFIYGAFIWSSFAFLGAIVICSIYSIYSLGFLPILLLPGYIITRFYINGSREISRIQGITRSPMINLLAETIPGAITIRAFNQKQIYMDKFHDRVDVCYSVQLFRSGAANWFGLVLGYLALLFLGFLLTFTTLFESNFSQGAIGIMLTYAINLQQNLFDLLTCASSFENAMVSVERCLSYTNIQSENPSDLESDKELINWPSHGNVKFVNYSVRYRSDTEIVLKDLSFGIDSGIKVGIVGRTGSGKSTLCLSMFRILEPSAGTIFIDDVDICNVGLRKLRSSITIIPQEPNLMKGSLKYNIDPLSQYSDEKITEIVKKIGFWYAVENNEKGLNQEITESGTNLSVGEKQLICICRALLRDSKVIIMDEATANIDIKTESIIHNCIKEIMKGRTIITIAHRIKTILEYDKILVLSQGEMIEYDSPDKLLSNSDSAFYQLYKKSKTNNDN